MPCGAFASSCQNEKFNGHQEFLPVFFLYLQGDLMTTFDAPAYAVGEGLVDGAGMGQAAGDNVFAYKDAAVSGGVDSVATGEDG